MTNKIRTLIIPLIGHLDAFTSCNLSQLFCAVQCSIAQTSSGPAEWNRKPNIILHCEQRMNEEISL